MDAAEKAYLEQIRAVMPGPFAGDCAPGASVTLGDIKATAISESDPLKVAKMVYAHEQLITGKISDLYTLAAEEKDYATVNFLNWFVTEQVEEEANARDLVDEFTFAGDSTSSQLFVDSRLGSRAK